MPNIKHHRRPGRHAGQRPGPRQPTGSRGGRPSIGGRKSGLWLFGTHAVLAALANPRRDVQRVLTTADLPEEDGAASLLAAGPWPKMKVTRPEIEGLLPDGAVHQGIAAEVMPLPHTSIEDLCAACAVQETAAVVVLDKVTDPRNVGAVLRSLAAFGAAGLVVPERGAPEESGTLAKAASGALERVPIVRVVNLKRAVETMKQSGLWCLGFDGGAETLLSQAPLGGRVALVFGAEGAGLRRLTREACDLLVRIPIRSEMESLNVSTAAAVALYEWARPR